MIAWHHRLRAGPVRFARLAGMTPAEFDSLVEEVRPRIERADRLRLERADRVRAIGGGPPHGLDPADQVLLILIRSRHGPTLAGLAGRLGVSAWTAIRILRRVGPIVAAARPGLSQVPRGRRINDEIIATLFDDITRPFRGD